MRSYDRHRHFELLRYRLPWVADALINKLTSYSPLLREEAIQDIEGYRDRERARIHPSDESVWRDLQIIAREERKLMERQAYRAA